MLDEMHPKVRYETLRLLDVESQLQQARGAKNSHADNVLSTHARAQRPSMSTRDMSREQCKMKKQVDIILQKDLIRRVCKWDRAAAKGRRHKSHGSKQQKQHSPGKNSMNSTYSLNDAATLQRQKASQQHQNEQQRHEQMNHKPHQVPNSKPSSKQNGKDGQFHGARHYRDKKHRSSTKMSSRDMNK